MLDVTCLRVLVSGQQQLPGSITKLKRLVARKRDNLLLVAKRLGIPATYPKPSLLHHTEGACKEPAHYAFPALPPGQIPGTHISSFHNLLNGYFVFMDSFMFNVTWKAIT